MKRSPSEWAILALLLGAVIWNVLCLVHLLPLKRWNFSCALIAAGSLLMHFTKPVNKAGKSFLAVWCVLLAAYIITAVACLVMPL